jgi:hypothetical protein
MSGDGPDNPEKLFEFLGLAMMLGSIAVFGFIEAGMVYASRFG